MNDRDRELKSEDRRQGDRPRTDVVLDNIIQFDRILTKGSREELNGVPYVELSKHVRIRQEAE